MSGIGELGCLRSDAFDVVVTKGSPTTVHSRTSSTGRYLLESSLVL